MRHLSWSLVLFTAYAWAETQPGSGHSRVRIRCPESCNVTIDKQHGRRLGPDEYEFTDVAGGAHTISLEGFLSRPLYSGTVDVPASAELQYMLTSGRRLIVSSQHALDAGTTAAPARTHALADQKGKRDGGTGQPRQGSTPQQSSAPSKLFVHCTQQCTVFVDGARRGISSGNGTVVPDVAPGSHRIEVKGIVAGSLGSDSLDVPPASEMYLTAGNGRITATSVKSITPTK